MKFEGASTPRGAPDTCPCLIRLTRILTCHPSILSPRLIIIWRIGRLLLAAIILLFLLLTLIGRILIWIDLRWLWILLLLGHRCLLCWWIRSKFELEARGLPSWGRRILSARLALGTERLGWPKGYTSGWRKGTLRASRIAYGKLGCLGRIRGRLLLLLLLNLLNLLISLRCHRLLLRSPWRLWAEIH